MNTNPWGHYIGTLNGVYYRGNLYKTSVAQMTTLQLTPALAGYILSMEKNMLVAYGWQKQLMSSIKCC